MVRFINSLEARECMKYNTKEQHLAEKRWTFSCPFVKKVEISVRGEWL